MSRFSPEDIQEIRRFCFQFLQQEKLDRLDFPSTKLLRDSDAQEALCGLLFEEGALEHPPPRRYQLKTLKELLTRIEASIDDWDKYVSGTHDI